jgi:hypothetical protein
MDGQLGRHGETRAVRRSASHAIILQSVWHPAAHGPLSGTRRRGHYGVTALDPITFTMMPLVLVVLAITASLMPALRALRIDPNTALREE